MATDLLQLAHRALAKLPAQDLRKSNVYLDREVYQAGAPVPMGRRTFTAPQSSLLLFVDLVPAANWSHPCKYFLVSTEDDRIQEIEGHYPPARERLCLLRRGEGAEDWTLLTQRGFESQCLGEDLK